MPYRLRLQERRASSRPHFWFWFLMVDDWWTEQQTVEEGAPELEWSSQARTSLQQTGFMYNFMYTHIKSRQWEHCLLSLLFLTYIIRNGFNFPTRSAVDCHGCLQRNNNNPWTCRMLYALKILWRPWAPLCSQEPWAVGRAGIALPSVEMQRAEGPLQGHQARPKRIEPDTHPKFYNLLIHSFTKYLGTYFCVWQWVSFRKYNSNSSCVEIKQLCDCFPLPFPWEGPGLVLCCNVKRYYFVFSQSLFCGRGGRGNSLLSKVINRAPFTLDWAYDVP